ncbi:MAG: TonB family protein [Acidobacteriota bacterium]|nr:TonB family protein [Acidobacteriota bacterium]
MASSAQVNPFDLLGQEVLYPRPIRLPGRVQPKLEIAWDSFHQNFFSSVAIFFKPAKISKDLPAGDIFKDCYIRRRVPRLAMLGAIMFHALVFLLPWQLIPAAGGINPELQNTEVTWSGPINDFPLLEMHREKVKPQPKGEANKPLPAEGADAFHPRQRIYTDPSRPTHPRQTLINPAAPPDAPKFLPEMPNIVRLENTSAPARPHMEISEKTLAKLRPRAVAKPAAFSALPTLDVPNTEQHTAEISLTAQQNGPAKPKLEINAASAPRIAERKETGDNTPAPDVPTASANNSNATSTFIALSATPGPVAPVAVPQGNLAARVAISPDGKVPGVPGGAPNTPPGGTGGAESGSNGAAGAGKNSIGVSISGGNPKPNTTVSGLGGGGLIIPKNSSTAAMIKRPDANSVHEDLERSGPPNFAALPPGSDPEKIFSSKRVYTMNVNMPNLNSATGSWIIHFSELHFGDPAHASAELGAPLPIRKVDPKYPPDMILEHVEGQIVLYGVIRKTGKVDSIQVVRSLEPQLDANSVSAFAEWKFQPASKDGEPVDLEAIVYIPFHAPSRQ